LRHGDAPLMTFHPALPLETRTCESLVVCFQIVHALVFVIYLAVLLLNLSLL